MAVTIQLKNFAAKASPVPADIIYSANSADSFNEVQITIEDLIAAYPGILSIGSLTTAADEMIYTTDVDTYATTAITAFGRSVVALAAAPTAPAAGSLAGWDTNKNMSANNYISAFVSTPSAAGTTVLTVTSAEFQEITGSTTQIVQLPVPSTMVAGTPFTIINNSSGVVTVNSSGGNLVQTMAAGTQLDLILLINSGTTAASWQSSYIIDSGLAGAVLLAPSADQTISAFSLYVTNGGIISGNILTPQGATREGQITSVGLSGVTGDFIAASYYSGGAGSAPTYWCYKSRSATVGSFAAVQTGDTLGRFLIFADDGTQFKQCASMVWQATGTVSTGIVPTVCTFSTMGSAGTLLPAYNISSAQIVSFNNAISSPNGINFGVSTLANYQETTWTPVFSFTTPGDLSVSYAFQGATSTRIGNLVTVSFQIVFTPTFTTASGDIQITGMTVNGSTSPCSHFGTVEVGHMTFGVGYTQVVCNIQSNIIYLYQNGTTAAIQSMGVANISTGVQANIYGTITYRAA